MVGDAAGRAFVVTTATRSKQRIDRMVRAIVKANVFVGGPRRTNEEKKID